MDTPRKDAARNRLRIIDAARGAVDRGEPLTFNSIARFAETGVGTVYRHFPSVEALEETLVAERFEELSEILHRATPAEIGRVLETYFGLLVDDRLFEQVTSRAEPALESTDQLRTSLIEALEALVGRGKEEGLLRNDLNARDLLALLCGLAYSARTLGVSADSPRGRLLLAILTDGLSGSASSHSSVTSAG